MLSWRSSIHLWDSRKGKSLTNQVRDKIPDIIRERGEIATIDVLDKEALILALREKLVEEAYELLDAKDLQSVVSELTDVKEVVDSLMARLNISAVEIANKQEEKRIQRGAFEKGIILVETQSMPPTSKTQPISESDFEGLRLDVSVAKVIDVTELRRRGESLEKRTDRRVSMRWKGRNQGNNIRSCYSKHGLVRLETIQERIEGPSGKVISGRVQGARNGSC